MTPSSPAPFWDEDRAAEIARRRTEYTAGIRQRNTLTAARAVPVTRVPDGVQPGPVLSRSEKYATALTETAHALSTALNLEATLDRTLTRLIEALDGTLGAIYLLDAAATHLRLCVLPTPRMPEIRPEAHVWPLADLPRAQKTVQTGIPSLVHTGPETRIFASHIPQGGRARTLVIPMIARGTPLGCVFILGIDLPDSAALAFAQAMGTHCALAVYTARRDATVHTEQAQLHTILAMAPVDISLWSPTGQLVQANDAYDFFAHFPVLPAEAAVQSTFRVEKEDGQVRDPTEYPLAQALQGGDSPPTFLRNVYPDGTTQEFLAQARWSADRQRIVCIYHEVGALRAALQHVADADATVAALKEADARKSRFLAVVSHELRTPLTGIRGFAELLTLRAVAPETVKEYAGKISISAARLQEILDEYLNVQRLEAGAEVFTFQHIDVGQLVRDVAETTPPDRTLVLQLEAVPPIWADSAKLRRVVENLVSNARKYSPTGTPITVGVRPGAPANMVEVTVTDHGWGIPLEDQPFIFEKFYRAKTSNGGPAQKGTGLGLALSREIVERHGGRMGFESTPGQGTTFWVRLLQDRRATPRL